MSETCGGCHRELGDEDLAVENPGFRVYRCRACGLRTEFVHRGRVGP